MFHSYRFKLIENEISNIEYKITQTQTIFNKFLTSKNDTTLLGLELEAMKQKIEKHDQLINPNNNLLIQTIKFRENFYAKQDKLENNISVINEQINKMHNFYISLLTIFLAFIIMIVAWMLSKFIIK